MRKFIIGHPEYEKIITSLGTSNNIDDTLDEAVICKNGWLMYGSSKPNKKPYELSYIFDTDLNESKLDELFKELNEKFGPYPEKMLEIKSDPVYILSANVFPHFKD